MGRPDPSELQKVVDFAAREAGEYLDTLADRPVRDPRADEVAARFGGSLPEQGVGAIQTLEELVAGFEEARRAGGDFCLATHYWEVSETMKTVMLRLIDHAARYAEVRFVAAEELFVA